MKKFCKSLEEHPMEKINFEKKKMIPLTDKEFQSYERQKICYICRKKVDADDKKYYKVRDHCHYTRKYISYVI